MPISCQCRRILRDSESVLRTFFLSDADRQEVLSCLPVEFDRHFSNFVKSVILAALLPVIQRRTTAYFERKRIIHAEAEDLAGDVVTRVMKSLFGRGIRGNAGAFVAKVRLGVLCDHRKKTKRRELAQDPAILAEIRDPTAEQESLKLLLDELPVQVREIIQMKREGQTWQAIAKSLEITEREARSMIQRSGCPGVSSSPKSPSIKRRKKVAS